MRRYTVILIRDDDGYSVSVPAFPNICTWGHSESEALANAQEAVELYVSVLVDEGSPLPDDLTTATVEAAA